MQYNLWYYLTYSSSQPWHIVPFVSGYSQLFGVGVPAISKHLKNIFEEGELDKEVVVSKMEITTQHGAMANKSQTHSVDFYHLDAIIAVGYRVSSLKDVIANHSLLFYKNQIKM